jgi:ABC-type spermidine/putrescine transport system permease subunit I
MPTPTGEIVGQRRWYWPIFAVPGLIWLVLLFLTPFYAIMAVAFGGLDPIFAGTAPAWNPADWDFTTFRGVVGEVFGGGGLGLQAIFIRTLIYVSVAVVSCILIGYPVAYFVARHAGRYKVLFLTLMIAPFWMSYLMRMLAWVNLLNNETAAPGLVNQLLLVTPFVDQPINWFAGQAAPFTVILGLVYGYIPFFILPLFAALDRIDKAQLEASRDLGASPFRTFWRVTLPLSKQGILAGSVIIMLPMFGDYYTPTLMSGSPSTTMVGNAIDFGIHTTGQSPRGASLTLFLSLFVAVLMLYYLLSVARAAREARQ